MSPQIFATSAILTPYVSGELKTVVSGVPKAVRIYEKVKEASEFRGLKVLFTNIFYR